MKISETTLNMLKNFSVINQAILVRPGSKITTMSNQESIIAEADVEEEFPVSFCLHELPRFLGVVSLFDNPDFEFGDKTVTIRSGKKKTTITYGDSAVITTPPPKGIKFPSEDVNFNLSWSELASVLKAATVMQLPEVCFSGRDGELFFEAVNVKNPTADTYSVSLGSTDKTFKMIFKLENLKMTNQDYEVSLSSKGISRFAGEKVTYFVMTETTSSYAG